ncbi:NAD-dependent epimerase/dehydratase family protein [Neisseriaceae bacterium TC5R-5]|nr:NAD-dependent epimerase/dehydratase family protein [Neisseriaceae bacterium TC5R-5]
MSTAKNIKVGSAKIAAISASPLNLIMSSKHNKTILVTGAHGFIGGYIVAALRRQGWRVILAVRNKGQTLAADERACDFGHMLDPADWLPLLNDVDAVVNVAGILRETAQQHFATIHLTAPLALAQACVASGGKRFIQISALGSPEDGEFIASKHRFDDALLALPLNAVVLRPSVVYATSGSYGGTSLLRAMAALPGLQLLPGKAQWQLQPLAAEDLAAIVLAAIQSNNGGLFEVGGPQAITLQDYQQSWRDWLRVPSRYTLHLPTALVSGTVALGEKLGRGPLGATMWRMLQRGNLTQAQAANEVQAAFGVEAHSLDQVLATHPSQVQDRWQAQLYFLAPLLRLTVVLLWLLSAWAGLLTPTSTIQHLVSGSLLEYAQPVWLARAGAIVDLLLGLWLLSNYRPRAAIVCMLLLLLTYTLSFGCLIPALWLDQLGGLAKNLVLLPALMVLWVVTESR